MTIFTRLFRLLTGPRATPTHCRCGKMAAVYDHEQPWKVWCGRCWLRKEGKL